MEKLKIGNLIAKYPIVQGGMGVGISRSGLAVAVANQGGIGVISAAGLGLFHLKEIKDYKEASIYGLKQEINKAKQKTKGIIGVNIMVALTNFSDMVKTAIDEQADVIFSGAGLPLDLPSYLGQGDKTKLVPIVSSARATKIICEKWIGKYDYVPDAIVVEGPKAGGHLWYKLNQLDDKAFSLEENLPNVVEEVKRWREKTSRDIPIIAAGGIYSGEDMYKIMKEGADAVQLATRFVTTNECDASIEFKNSYINAKKEDIIIIKSPVGMPGRAIKNKFLESVARGEKCPKQCVHHCIKTCDNVNSPYCIMIALINAYYGNLDKGFCFAGSNAYKAKEIISVEDTFNALIKEYEDYENSLTNL